MLYTLRQACTRDDVQYTRLPPACEVVETRTGANYKPPIRKMVVYNQKYAIPAGLLVAKSGGEGAECPMEEIVPETLDWYMLMGRFVPWFLWGTFLYLYKLF